MSVDAMTDVVAEANHSDMLGSDKLDNPPATSSLSPSRWWFASTAFPLLAGTFGPIASAFNICALAVHWRAKVPAGTTQALGLDLEDPLWLLVVNGLSLSFALAANFALLLNMTRRISFSVAQPITIIGWYVASILLIGDLITVTCQLNKSIDTILTGAFYYAVFAAGLYMIIASLMVITVFGTWRGHYPRDFRLTLSQRTLMLQTIGFMVYLLGGAAIFSRIEGWNYLDAVYFADYTLLTVGIGDVAPVTHSGRAILFPFAIGGIVSLGLVVGSIRSLVLERGKIKLGNRLTEKKREALIKSLLKHGEVEKITPLVTEKHAQEVGISEQERRRAEFQLMRQVQGQTETRQKWVALLLSAGAWAGLWFIGAVVFFFAEKHEQGWTYFQSVYFGYTSLLTIGYGDLYPTSNAGKAFFVFWSLLAVPTLTIVISDMGDTVVKLVRDTTIFLGEFTVLPGEQGARTRLRTIAKSAVFKVRAKDEEFDGQRKPRDVREEQVGGISDFTWGNSTSTGTDDKTEHQPTARHSSALVDRARALTSQELDYMHQAKQAGQLTATEVHKYHYAIVHEFRNVLDHLTEKPARRYSYDEWAYYLKLMGQNEELPDQHRQPTIKAGQVHHSQGHHAAKHEQDHKHKHKRVKAHALSSKGKNAPREPECNSNCPDSQSNIDRASIDNSTTSHTGENILPSKPRHRELSGEKGAQARSDHAPPSTTTWSWLGAKSPLMAEQEEAEWILDALTTTLMRSLHDLRNVEECT